MRQPRILLLLAILLTLLVLAYSVTPAGAQAHTCGWGRAEWSVPGDWTVMERDWSETDGFICPAGVRYAAARFVTEGGSTPPTPDCYGWAWGDEGWTVYEKGGAGCGDVVAYDVTWTCKCWTDAPYQAFVPLVRLR